jgi:glutathione synthase/RimK-type ligase-like ATP-grasp enzyme
VVSARDYLTRQEYGASRGVRVYNLCREYRYQSKGYYVSLLAEARRHRVVPSVKTIQDLKVSAAARFESDDLDEIATRLLANDAGPEFTLDVYFAETLDPRLRPLARELHGQFEAPLLRARFLRVPGGWQIRSVVAIPVSAVPRQQWGFVEQAATRYFQRRPARRPDGPERTLDLAILVNPEERDPPSDRRAIERFERAAERAGFTPEIVGRDDYGDIAGYDALLIRETTTVHHHTYRFARKAEAEGLAVIDDPDSILRCANKVFLAELMRTIGVPTPATMIVHSDNRDDVEATLGLPCVLKQPDSSFSRGVVRANEPEELRTQLDALLGDSELVIAQAYLPTDFDWRIGVLEGEALYACKYFMARGHWQILNWQAEPGAAVEGAWETLPVEDAPPAVVDVAVRAARAIGDGLYGIDVKEVDGQPLLIEVNDNPNIEAGVEDQVLGDALYDRIIAALRRRVEARTLGSLR